MQCAGCGVLGVVCWVMCDVLGVHILRICMC